MEYKGIFSKEYQSKPSASATGVSIWKINNVYKHIITPFHLHYNSIGHFPMHDRLLNIMRDSATL